MAENYKLLYEQTKRMLEKYQDEIVPGMRKVIEDLKKERAEVVHGRWEWLGPYRYNGDGEIGTCSVCKERLRLFEKNYCPNCGAKMYGGNEDG